MLARFVAVATLFVLPARSPVIAQRVPTTTRKVVTSKGEIVGRVVTATGHAPIGFANVEVTMTGAKTLTARASTTRDGGFRVFGLKAGHYRVLVRALGYAPRDLSPVVLDAAAQGVDVGTVQLTAVALQLQSVQVGAQRPDVQLSPDRNTFVVRDMPSTQGGTALDVLRNVPAVDVDIDNVVSLRGNSGVVVEINGRTSPLKPAQLGNFLAQLPAAIVDKVEVIPNPSARDDPTGVAGIINVVLKQKADAGTSGGVTVGGGTTGHADVGGNLGYQSGPLSLYGSYSFLRDNRPRTESVYRENNYVVPMTFLEESALRTQIPLAHTLTGSATYKLGNNDELSSDMMYSTRAETETYGILYHDLNAARVLTGASNRMTRDVNHEIEFESTLGYKHTFAGKGHTLSSEVRIFRNREGGPNSVVADTLPPGSPPIVTALESQTGWAHPHENSLKVDYVRPLSKYVRLETGYKGSLQDFHTTLNTQVFNSALAAYQPDSTRISDFTYRQLVNAAYGMVDAQTGKFLLQGGIRVERATTKFHLNLSNSTYDNLYNSIFPSALIAYNIDDSRQIKLSYSTRIQRPDDTDLLDPTPRYTDPLNLFRGNPYLKPEYIRSFELGFQRNAGAATIQITPFYRHTLNAITTLRSIDSAGVSTRTFANVATTDGYGTDANVALSGGRLSGFAGASLFRQVSNAPNLAAGLNARTFGWNARTNVSFHASGTLDLQALLFYRSAMTVAQGRNASRTRFSLAARQKLMDNRVSLTLRVIDPFNTSRERSTTVDPLFYQVSDRARTIRGLLLSVNWMFGRPQKSENNGILDQGGSGGN